MGRQYLQRGTDPFSFCYRFLIFPWFLLGKQPLIFKKILLWQQSGSSCGGILQRWWFHRPIPNRSICKMGCKCQWTSPLACTDTQKLQAWPGIQPVYCMSSSRNSHSLDIIAHVHCTSDSRQSTFLNPISLFKFFHLLSRGAGILKSTTDIFVALSLFQLQP
jgi:hypothetical protein